MIFSVQVCMKNSYATTSRADRRRRIAIKENKLIRITDTRSMNAIDAAVEYFTSIITVRWTSTGSVNILRRPKEPQM